MSEPFQVGPVTFWATGDRVLIEEDKFRSGYECSKCSGEGKLSCDGCGGIGHYVRNDSERKCSACDGTGKITCPECEGKGGVLAIPEVAQRRPTTGRIVSVGPDVKNLSVDQDVLYSNLMGHVIDLQDGTVLRILKEPEILCRLEGHLEFRMVRRKTDLIPV